MSLDGIVVKSIVNELNKFVIDSKIEKIYQPEKDEIIVNVRNNGKNTKVLLSSSSNNPRIYITNAKKTNPIKPPMFCMLLRKHLHNGKIVSIVQPEFERIIIFEINNLDELGVLSTKQLIIEIMGRHSNIILVDKSSQKIIDSIKRITPEISRIRQILPNIKYQLPPSQNKINPLLINKKTLFEHLESNNINSKVFQKLYRTFTGISPLIAKEICYRACINPKSQIDNLNENQRIKLAKCFIKIINNIKINKFCPTIVKENYTEKILSFSAIDLEQYSGLPKQHLSSISSVLEKYYVTRDKLDRINQKSANLRKTISIKLERNYKKLSKQKEELLTAKRREKFRLYGELITANIYKIKKGQIEIICQNYYSNDSENVKISLNPQLTPSQNAQKYFKKYNKLKNAHKIVSKQLVNTEQEITYLENVLLSIQDCTEVDELDEIKQELIDEGYIKRKKRHNKNHSNNTSKPRHFISSDGFDIFVGKNNRQNDYLTLKYADKSDLWFHTKTIPGSHVIIKTNNKSIPENTILEAALLASYYSKGKMSSNVPVDYTVKKNVKKPSGAKPGMVIYDNYTTLYVTPKLELIHKIIEIKK